MELAVLAPSFLAVIMLIVQFGLWFNARQVALASAQAGARVARQEFATSQNWRSDSASTSTRYYRALNTRLLGSLTATPVTVTNGGTQDVGVTVSGPLGFSLFSWFGTTWTISETVTGPAECFHPAADGGACG